MHVFGVLKNKTLLWLWGSEVKMDFFGTKKPWNVCASVRRYHK